MTWGDHMAFTCPDQRPEARHQPQGQGPGSAVTLKAHVPTTRSAPWPPGEDVQRPPTGSLARPVEQVNLLQH